MIAINWREHLPIIEEFLERFLILRQNRKKCKDRKECEARVILRPYPGGMLHKESERIARRFQGESWFVYDTTDRLSAEVMRECCCLVGDTSSLTYTFALTCLKPVILLFKDAEFLRNSYANISFYNPILHKIAHNAEEICKCVREIRNECAQERAQKIREYREKEVFNLGKSSEFIANFVLQLLKKGQE